MANEKKSIFDLLELSNKATAFIEKNFKVGLLLAVIGIACSAAWVGMKNVEANKEEKAFASLFAITNEYNTRKENFDKAKSDKKEEKKEKQEELAKASGDLEKDYGDITKKLEGFLASNKNMQASGEAALTLSSIYQEYDKTDQAAQSLSQTLKDWTRKGLLTEIMQMRAGDLWSMANQCEKAILHWKVLASSNSFLSAQAQLKLGLCFQKTGDRAQAKSWLQKVTSKSAKIPAGFSAKKYLRYIDFEKIHKKEESVDKTADEKNKKSETSS